MIADDDDDDDDGRTIVRGAPKIIKRSSAKHLSPMGVPTSISPTAVIKATLESASSSRRENLMPGPPRDLLEDRSDFGDGGSARPPFARQAPLFEGPPSGHPFPAPLPSHPHHLHADSRSALIATGSHRAMDVSALGANAPSMPASSMPAHFMTAHAPLSEPPPTAVTSGHRLGRPAISWVAALVVCGLLIGVGAFVLIHRGGLAEVTAAFVDPARAVANPSSPESMNPVPPPAAPEAPPAAAVDTSAPPSSAVGALAAVPAVAAAAAPPVAEATVETAPATPSVGEPTGPAAPAAAAPAAAPVVKAAPAAPVVAKAAPAAPAPRPQAATPKPVAPTPAPAPKPKPVAVAAAADDDPPPKTEKKKPAAKTGSKSDGRSDADDETRKALEALQKAQLESASSFGKD